MDIKTLAVIIEETESQIYGFCFHLAGSRENADNLYQDTILKALELAEKIDKNHNPKGYILSIAIGLWKNQKRKYGRHNRIAPVIPMDETIENIARNGELKPEEILDKKISRELLQRAIASLDEKYRIPLILFYYNQSAVAEIATLCKIPQGTVKSRLSKGRSLLKVELEKGGYVYEG